MLKRSATTELNHDNWNDEEESEEPNDFKLASPEVMKNRVIRTGKRRLASSKPAAFSPFAKFNFGGNSDTANSSSSNAFNFLSAAQPSATTNGHAKEPPKSEEVKKEEKKSESQEEIKGDYLGKLKNLNEQCLAWITHHIEKNKTCILTPVFDDYAKYLKEYQSERDSKLSSVSKSTTVTSEGGTTSGFKFTGLPSTTRFAPSTTSFFNSNTTLTSTGTSSSTGTGNVGFGIFGNLPKPSSDTAAKEPFSFGSVKPFSAGGLLTDTKPEAATASTSEDNEEPPKNEFTPVTEGDAIFSQRVKVFVKKDKEEYADRGVGTLYIKPAADKHQAVVRADTSLGNLLLNIVLTDSIPIKRMGKNNVLLVCVPIPGADKKPMPTLLKVKTTEEADKLCEELTKYKK